MKKLVIGLVLAGVGTLGVAPAYADTVVNGPQWCRDNNQGRNEIPGFAVGSNPPIPVCYPPNEVPGLFYIHGMPTGSHPVDPANLMGDWAIPDPKPPAPYMWQKDPGVWQGPCPPTCP
jgi:hypothetical protein